MTCSVREDLEALVKEQGHLTIPSLGCVQEERPTLWSLVGVRVEKDLHADLHVRGKGEKQKGREEWEL